MHHIDEYRPRAVQSTQRTIIRPIPPCPFEGTLPPRTCPLLLHAINDFPPFMTEVSSYTLLLLSITSAQNRRRTDFRGLVVKRWMAIGVFRGRVCLSVCLSVRRVGSTDRPAGDNRVRSSSFRELQRSWTTVSLVS